MAKRNNKEVILAFLNRQVGVSNSNNSLRTGYNLQGELCLYSYSLCIARYTGDGPGQGDSFYFYDYTAGGLGMVSQTTSTHVGLLHRAGRARYSYCSGACREMWSIWNLDGNSSSSTRVDGFYGS
jgi:hypothetical protein